MSNPKSKRSAASTKLIEDLVSEYDLILRRFVRVRTNQYEDYDDIMQEIYVKLSQVSDLPIKLAGRMSTVKNYLLQIANHVIIDRARHAQSRCTNDHISQIEESHCTNLTSPERIYTNKAMLNLTEKALAELNPVHRQAFLLNRINGLSYREVSDQLDVSISTVEKYIAATLHQIRRATNQPEPERVSKNQRVCHENRR
ncbi:RNA polymerase sigma factor [Idiomarina sp. HP20-50]|uniref:RNA polymerase sigma factor n=1 Tax=Idiomarina sp. HP20-50 TaxID=3070813 RepID=UPI00294B6BF5|nr:RNA polymerase sigma factor [Idiomarina sp. HP20-50]